MNKDFNYILKKVLIGVLIATLLFSLKSCKVEALTIQEQQWYLNPEQYIRSTHSNGNTYSFTKTSWGNIVVNAYRRVYTYGAYVSNPVCDLDYCIAPNSSYIFNFVITSDKAFNSNVKNVIGNKNSINLRLSYLNSNNQKTWVTVNNSNITNYKITPYSANSTSYSIMVQFVANIPDLPDNQTTSHFMDIDFWVTSPSSDKYNNYILDTSSSTVNTGISLFIVQYATPVDIENMEQGKINESNQSSIINNQNSTNEKLDDLNNTMQDSSTDSPLSGINSVQSGLASNGVITQLITLPVTLFQQILTSINGTCQTFNLGSLFGTDLVLPCINVSNYLGSTLWGIIDVIISGYFVWVIARKMISAFEMFSAMKDGDVLDD